MDLIGWSGNALLSLRERKRWPSTPTPISRSRASQGQILCDGPLISSLLRPGGAAGVWKTSSVVSKQLTCLNARQGTGLQAFIKVTLSLPSPPDLGLCLSAPLWVLQNGLSPKARTLSLTFNPRVIQEHLSVYVKEEKGHKSKKRRKKSIWKYKGRQEGCKDFPQSFRERSLFTTLFMRVKSGIKLKVSKEKIN